MRSIESGLSLFRGASVPYRMDVHIYEGRGSTAGPGGYILEILVFAKKKMEIRPVHTAGAISVVSFPSRKLKQVILADSSG